MKISVPSDALAAALAAVAPAVAGKPTRPVLSGVLARAGDGLLTLSATDQEVGVRYEVRGVAVETPGVCVLPHARLTAILREAGGGGVSVAATADGIRVRAGGRFELPAADPAEFPDVPEWEAGAAVEVAAGVLRGLVRRTAFAADRKDSTRFALSGVLFEADGPTLRLVATDSKRLAVAEGPATAAGGPGAGAHLLPAKALALIDKVLADDGELVQLALRPNDALFRTERATVYTRLVEGRYPPYRDILGQCKKTKAVSLVLPRLAFLGAVRSAAIMTDDESKRVDVTFAAGRVVMQARGASTGSSEVTLDLPDYAGPDLLIAFDPGYLADFLKAVDDEAVTLEMTDGTKPALFGAAGGCRYLVMPLAG